MSTKPKSSSTQVLHAASAQQGNAAIEFALILVPLLLLLCAIISYASYFLVQQRVNHTVGDVARIVSLQRYELGTPEVLDTVAYEALISARLAEDGWLNNFSQTCAAGSNSGGLCHETLITRPGVNEGESSCKWLAGVSQYHDCVKVALVVDIEGWLLTDLLRHIGRSFSDTANWVPKYASASVVVRLQNNR